MRKRLTVQGRRPQGTVALEKDGVGGEVNGLSWTRAHQAATQDLRLAQKQGQRQAA